MYIFLFSNNIYLLTKILEVLVNPNILLYVFNSWWKFALPVHEISLLFLLHAPFLVQYRPVGWVWGIETKRELAEIKIEEEGVSFAV